MVADAVNVQHARHLEPRDLEDPRWARALFTSTWAAWLWLVVRLYVASVFLPSAWSKITSGAWLFGTGAPMQGMLDAAITNPGTPGWYVTFLEEVVLPNAGLFATLVTIGELTVGLALLVGLLTGIAAFGGVFLNANFLLAGALGPNPVLIALGVLLVLAWRNAGWIGLDRWLLPWGHRGFARRSRPGPAPRA